MYLMVAYNNSILEFPIYCVLIDKLYNLYMEINSDYDILFDNQNKSIKRISLPDKEKLFQIINILLADTQNFLLCCHYQCNNGFRGSK